MVSPLKYYGSDPNKKGRGAGYYYRRAGYKRGWNSKYEGTRDGSRKVTKATKVSGRYEHAGDIKPAKKTYHTIRVGKRRGKQFFGFF